MVDLLIQAVYNTPHLIHIKVKFYMNVTELARRLRVHPKKLLEILPEKGLIFKP